MDQIAFIIGDTFLYWYSLIIALGAAAAVLLFWGFYLGTTGDALGAALCVPLSMALSIAAARFAHWYCRADSYASFAQAMTDYSSGGYALMGVFAACILTALILRLCRIVPSLPKLTDAMSLAGCAGIALGRLAPFYSAADRGAIVTMTTLPWAYPVVNSVTGATEYRLATFLLQSIVCAVIFGILVLGFFLTGKKRHPGDTTAFFFLLYCAAQIVLDSTRYDSLFMRSNGFVSFVQVLSALAIAAVAVRFSVGLVKNRGFRGWYVGVWIGLLALMGGAGYMEYYVQRHGDRGVLAYSVMSACLAAYCLGVTVIWALGRNPRSETVYPKED